MTRDGRGRSRSPRVPWGARTSPVDRSVLVGALDVLKDPKWESRGYSNLSVSGPQSSVSRRPPSRNDSDDSVSSGQISGGALREGLLRPPKTRRKICWKRNRICDCDFPFFRLPDKNHPSVERKSPCSNPLLLTIFCADSFTHPQVCTH